MKPKLFLDSSALIAAMINRAAAANPSKLILLGEAGVVDQRISNEVIDDAERFAKRRDPAMLLMIAGLISQGRMGITSDPNRETIDFCLPLTNYEPDARILAAAIEVDADVLVTNDKRHLWDNKNIKPPGVRVMVMNPQETVDWCYEQWTSR